MDQDDPQVQKNGFREIVRAIDLDPKILDGSPGDGVSFFDDYFDPHDTWENNLDRFKRFVMGTGMLNRQAEEVVEQVE